jgi:hypothetical protein
MERMKNKYVIKRLENKKYELTKWKNNMLTT